MIKYGIYWIHKGIPPQARDWLSDFISSIPIFTGKIIMGRLAFDSINDAFLYREALNNDSWSNESWEWEVRDFRL